MSRVNNRIQVLRERLHKQTGEHSQREVAERLGVSEKSIQRWEAGDSVPSVVEAQALAADLGVTMEQLGFRRLPS